MTRREILWLLLADWWARCAGGLLGPVRAKPRSEPRGVSDYYCDTVDGVVRVTEVWGLDARGEFRMLAKRQK